MAVVDEEVMLATDDEETVDEDGIPLVDMMIVAVVVADDALGPFTPLTSGI